MKKKLVIVSGLSVLLFPLFLVVLIMGAFASNGQAKGLQTKLTAKEVLKKPIFQKNGQVMSSKF